MAATAVQSMVSVPNAVDATTANGTSDVDDYSVPEATAVLFQKEILQNSLISRNLPADAQKYAAPISFRGSKQPSICINWRFAESSAALKALEGTFVNALLVKKYGQKPQNIVIDTDHASLFFMSCFLYEIDPEGRKLSMKGLQSVDAIADLFPDYNLYRASGDTYRAAVTNIYQTRDQRYFHLHGSLNPDASFKSVGLPTDKNVSGTEEAIEMLIEAMGQIDSEEMDRRCAEEYKQAGTICLSTDEFKNSEHGKANAHVALYDIHEESTGHKPSWWPDSPQTGPSRPLAGLKVVDITRIIAAPTITRGLAELGASVMRVTAPHLPDINQLHPDLNWGKWNCSLDLRKEEDMRKMKDLIMDADVVVSGYRPGSMERWGLGPKDIFEMVKGRDRGIIIARENCYGWNGPWADRIGWQQISDANCGVSLEYGRAMGHNEPVTPVFPNSDYSTGISGVCGIIDGILRRGEKGGSYIVDLALNYYSQWLVNSVGTYPTAIWEDLWRRNGQPVFRHYHQMNHTIPRHLEMLSKPGNTGQKMFAPDNFEVRDCPNLKTKIKTVKPILRFPDGLVKPGFNVGTRGNGADAARWPEDLMTQTIT